MFFTFVALQRQKTNMFFNFAALQKQIVNLQRSKPSSI